MYIWASGNRYDGSYLNDERDGFGTMVWKEGFNQSVYVGQWQKGIQHGFGKMTFPNDKVKEGYFENNIYIGPNPPTPKASPPFDISKGYLTNESSQS